VRFTLLLASSALAASLVLSACSGSSSIPTGSQSVAPMSRHAGTPMLSAVGAKHDTSCPSAFYECFEISKTSPATQEWCIIYSGTSDCTDLYPGTWTWASANYKVKKGAPTSKKDKKISSSFSPNPGNPTDLTISTKSGKSSKGKITGAVELSVCNSASSCLGPIYIGISTT
jgi:hypothetical protein